MSRGGISFFCRWLEDWGLEVMTRGIKNSTQKLIPSPHCELLNQLFPITAVWEPRAGLYHCEVQRYGTPQ